ncbi:bifunctional polysaccharide deacetylase/glycosyltransferase family 2 protein [Arthrobacter sp. H14]|uniref:bifunctional polysaccharide deacetylase/glycosyltransferase family 2 protein n=1 Tax=Arthrobacter sp. H14 TaxID=1312959 RepID=UPI0004B12BCB|nr:glycosyltransferase [Arthrobacter sp. H14]
MQASLPIFFDPSGKRWRRLIVCFILMMLILIGTAAWILPQAVEPTWTPERNGSSDYPRELLAAGDQQNIPLLGVETGYTFVRIALAEHKDGKVYLKDPFSDTIFRAATENEAKLIGEHPYVMERFGAPADHQLMLTFDDGPSAKYTPQILDLLSREGVPATFFSIGENIVENPEIFERIVREGHMVGNHTMTHADFYAHDDLRNREELIGTDRIMRSSEGYASRLFRIPEGDPENNALAVLQAQQLGYRYVDMDIDTGDWSYEPGEEIPVPKLDGSGAVVLMHDAGGDRTATVQMLEKFIAEAKAKGYTFSTLAPILPPEFRPVQTVDAGFVDHATFTALTLFLVTPATTITWLFWFGIGSLTIMSALYVVLAVIGHRRQQRKRWQSTEEDCLPFVSVILPVFNEEPVVEKTLAALKSSDYPAMEVIAVDDGSTDDTLSIMREFARNWPKLRVLTQENAGKSAASNFGISSARGEIIVTLDGDTIFEPPTVRMLARHFIDDDGTRMVGAVAGHVKVGNRRNLLTAWQSLEYISGICVTRMAEGLVGAISIVPGACAAWRREALVAAGGYSHDTMAEDADLTLCIQNLGYKIVQENRAVAWTEAPMTVRGLAKQRLRWTYGNLQALYKHRSMIMRPKYGVLGLIALPYALLATLIPLVFMPLTVIVAGISLANGQWESIAAFAAFVAITHMVISIVAVVMVRERAWHLLIVPIYRLIYEPLRAYLLYASLAQALKGRVVGWYKPERTNSVTAPVTPAVPVNATATAAMARLPRAI